MTGFNAAKATADFMTQLAGSCHTPDDAETMANKMMEIRQRVFKDFLEMGTAAAAAMPVHTHQPAHGGGQHLALSAPTVRTLEQALADLRAMYPHMKFDTVEDTVTPDYIYCLEDGKPLKMLKRHLQSSYGLTPDAYRAKWGLSMIGENKYPMTSPNYAEKRSDLAISRGLGKTRGENVSPKPRALKPGEVQITIVDHDGSEDPPLSEQPQQAVG